MPKRAAYQLAWQSPTQSYILEAQDVPLGINVGAEAWFAWLEGATSFAFLSRSGDTATIRKEAVQRGGAYWYAYRRVAGRMTKRYLGRNADLTIDRLEAMTTSLAETATADTSAPTPARPTADVIPPTQPAMLLVTKIQAPRIAKPLVHRPHVQQRLQRGLTRPLTLITAPAGFGKSTSLRAWLEEAAQQAAWVSLDAGDDEPILFWTYVLTALNSRYPAVADVALGMLSAPHPPPLTTMLRALLNSIAQREEEIVLVLDDYHLITAPAIHESLAVLLEHPPTQFHLFVASRVEPPLPLARLRARDQVNEIRSDELRFRPDETAVFLADVIGIALNAEEITTLAERADGWIAGLQLAGISLQGHPEPARFIATFSGSHRHIMSYLGEEVLAAQPPEIQSFLLQTAVLERLCASLCDAVTQRHDSHSLLERVQQANLFVIPLDDEGCWYRYHHLFADLLRQRLHEQDGTKIAAIHRRAAQWLESGGWISEAVDHLMCVPDIDAAARLIEQAARPLLLHGDVGPLRHLLERVPEEGMLARPFLCLIHVHVLFYGGNLPAAARRLATAERFLSPEPDGTYALDTKQRHKLKAYVAVVKATLPAMEGDADATLAQAQAAQTLLATLPRDALYNGDTLNVPIGLAHQAKGDLAAAEVAFAAASRAGLADGNLAHAALAQMLRAGALLGQGRLRETGTLFQHLIQLVETEAHAPRVLACGIYIDLVGVLYERNDLAAARVITDKCIALGKQWANDDDLVSAYIQSAMLYQAQGQPDSAWAEVERAEALFQQMMQTNMIFPWVPSLISTSIARLAICQGRLDVAENWARANGFNDDAGITDRLRHNQEFADATYARLLLAQGRHETAARFLDRCLPMAQSAGHNGSVIKLAMLRARAWQASGDNESALEALQLALTLAAPEGYARTFIDEGGALRGLLLRARERQPKESALRGYCDMLLTAFHPETATPATPTRQPLIEPLSPREREVLRLLAEGCSNQEIARHLVVAVSTIKTHLHHLFAKLQTTDRLQSVLRARELGLIDD